MVGYLHVVHIIFQVSLYQWHTQSLVFKQYHYVTMSLLVGTYIIVNGGNVGRRPLDSKRI